MRTGSKRLVRLTLIAGLLAGVDVFLPNGDCAELIQQTGEGSPSASSTEVSAGPLAVSHPLVSPWRPDEKRRSGRPILTAETKLDTRQLAWPPADQILLKARWATDSVFAKTPCEILLSDDLRHVAYVAQKSSGRFVVTVDGTEGPACDRVVGEIRLRTDFQRLYYSALINGKLVSVHHGAKGAAVYENDDTLSQFPRRSNVRVTDDLEHVTSLWETALHAGDFEVDGVRAAEGIRHELLADHLISHTPSEAIGVPEGILVDGRPLPEGAQRLAISDDGRHRMFVLQTKAGAENETEVWLDDRRLSTHSARSQDVARPHFSPDGNHLAYVVYSTTQDVAAVSLWLDGRELVSFPSGSFDRIRFGPDSQNVACVYDPGVGGKPFVVVNGYSGQAEVRGLIDHLVLGRNSCDVAYTAGSKLVVNGQTLPMEKNEIRQMIFTTDASHVIGCGASGRVGVMADGEKVPVNADTIWNLQAVGADRFTVLGCRGPYSRGLANEFVRFEFAIVER